MPSIILQPNISIITGAGPQDVRNPFYSYKFKQFPLNATLFPPGPIGTDGVLANYSETARGVTLPGDGNNFDTVNQQLSNLGLMSETVSSSKSPRCTLDLLLS